MEIKFKESLNLQSTNLNLDDSRYKKILNEIISEIKDNKQYIQKANEVDKKYYNTSIEVDKLINIIEKLKEKKLTNNQKSNNILISYYGDSYITLELCIEAIRTNNKLILLIEDYMLGVNKIILNIIENILKDYKIKNKIFLFNLLDKEENINNNVLIEEIICVGKRNTIEVYKKAKLNNLFYYPFNNIDIYCDTDELEDLQKMIYEYGIRNNIDVTIYDEFEDINTTVDYINSAGSGFATVLLTKSKENEKIFKEKIKSKYVFINENPFDKYEFDIESYLKS